MAVYTTYRVTELPATGIDESGVYYLKTDDGFKVYMRSNSEWVEQEGGSDVEVRETELENITYDEENYILTRYDLIYKGEEIVLSSHEEWNQKLTVNNSNIKTIVGDIVTQEGDGVNLNFLDVSSVTNMGSMFQNSSFNGDISQWDVSSVTNMSYMFLNSPFNGDISQWDVSSVTGMIFMFNGASEFNQDLSGWCVQNISGEPSNFSTGATAWTLPKPVWGTCPKPLKSGDNISELTNDSGFVSNSEDTYSSTPKITQIISLTEDEYDALSVKDENTLYIIIED